MKIEKGIPILEAYNGKYSKWREVGEKMKVGDSLFFEKRAPAYSAITCLRRHGGKYSFRLVDGGCRIWRTT